MRLGITSDQGPFDEFVGDLVDPVSTQIMCSMQFQQTGASLPPSTLVSNLFGTVLLDGNLSPVGDPVIGLIDGAAVQLNAVFRFRTVLVDSATITGYSWDAVSGAFNMWQLGAADPSGFLTLIYNSVHHVFPAT